MLNPVIGMHGLFYYSFYLELTVPKIQNKSLIFVLFLLDVEANLYHYSSVEEKCSSLRT